MRNLAQYPVMTEEVLRTLDRIKHDIEQNPAIGDTRLLVLTYVGRFLRANEPALADFLVQEQPHAAQAQPVADREKAAQEAIAAIFYDLFSYPGPGAKPAWVPGGNSFKQDEARRLARHVLEGRDPIGLMGEAGLLPCHSAAEIDAAAARIRLIRPTHDTSGEAHDGPALKDWATEAAAEDEPVATAWQVQMHLKRMGETRPGADGVAAQWAVDTIGRQRRLLAEAAKIIEPFARFTKAHVEGDRWACPTPERAQIGDMLFPEQFSALLALAETLGVTLED